MPNMRAREQWNRAFRRLLLPLLIALASTATAILLTSLDGRLNQLEQDLTGERQADLPSPEVKPIVIVKVDKDTIAQLEQPGHVGIPRSYYARLLVGLRKAGATSVVMDIYFQDPIPGADVDLLAALRMVGESDHPMPVTLLGDTEVEADPREPDGQSVTFVPPGPMQGTVVQNVWLAHALPILNKNSLYGIIPVRKDHTTGKLIYHIALSATLQYLKHHFSSLQKSARHLSVGPISWELGANDELTPIFTTNYRAFPEIELTQALRLLESGNGSKLFKDKLVVIGNTAPNVDDHYELGRFGQKPGVYFVAQMINTLLQPEFARPRTYSFFENGLVILPLAFFAAWGLLSLRLGISVPLSIAMIVAGCFGPVLLAGRGIVVLNVPPVLAVLLSVLLGAGFAVLFGHRQDTRPQGLSEQCTVLFVDIENSTGLTQQLGAARYESLHSRLNSMWHSKVVQHKGEIERTTGDGFMAIFRSSTHPDHALLAVRCAESIVQATDVQVPVRLHAGVETGILSGGYVHEGKRRSWSSSGKSLILAQRLLSIAAKCGVSIAIGPVAAQLIEGQIQTVRLGSFAAKGFEHEIEVFGLDSGKTPL